jgi:F-type H+-transporting ATPase subunit epsilon
MAMEVHLVTPEREVWTGPATMVVARGSDGDVGILPNHAPMLITLAIGALYIHNDAQVQAVAVDGGFLHVISGGGDTRVDVLAEHAELEQEIDLDAAERLRSDAERRLAERATESGRADLARAMARLRVAGQG